MQNKPELKRGLNDLPYLELRHASGAQVDIYLHGAHVTSWQTADRGQMFFLSKKTCFQAGKPIRGGIPIVFPQFGDGPLPKHGLARIQAWKPLGIQALQDGALEAKLELKEDQQTLKLWPHKFRLELAFRLDAQSLDVSFSIHNTGSTEFSFQNGLHTYFFVADIAKTFVQGLAGSVFTDFVGRRETAAETRRRIGFESETDRVYPAAPDQLTLEDNGRQLKMTVEKRGMRDVVLWNPWVDKSKRMEDFGDEEYKNMVCIETGNLHQQVRLAAGATHQSSTRFSAVAG